MKNNADTYRKDLASIHAGEAFKQKTLALLEQQAANAAAAQQHQADKPGAPKATKPPKRPFFTVRRAVALACVVVVALALFPVLRAIFSGGYTGLDTAQSTVAASMAAPAAAYDGPAETAGTAPSVEQYPDLAALPAATENFVAAGAHAPADSKINTGTATSPPAGAATGTPAGPAITPAGAAPSPPPAAQLQEDPTASSGSPVYELPTDTVPHAPQNPSLWYSSSAVLLVVAVLLVALLLTALLILLHSRRRRRAIHQAFSGRAIEPQTPSQPSGENQPQNNPTITSVPGEKSQTP